MGAFYNNLTTDKITVTNPLTFGPGTEFTYYQWFRREVAYFDTSVGTSKGALGTDFIVWFTGVNQYGASVLRATTNAEILTNTDIFPNGSWSFGCVTYTEAAGLRLYKGAPGVPATEVTYATQTVGAGSTSAETGDLYVNNRGAAASSSLGGTLGVAAFFDRALPLGEIVSQQFHPRPNSNCRFLYVPFSTTTIPDLSGNGRAGTGTGLEIGDAPPIANPFGRTPSQILRPAVSGGGGGGGSAVLRGNRVIGAF